MTDHPPPEPDRRVPVFIAGGVAAIMILGGALVWNSERKINKTAMADSPKPVSYVEAQKAQYRAKRQYVGTLEPWIMAHVGPQFISAYVDTVLVRPGAVVRRGEVIATLDCRNASAESQSIAMQARALDARQQALAHEAARTQGMLGGGYVSQNAAEQISAQSAAEQAELESTRAKLTKSSLEVSDCILRAPFNGEVATRTIDPGAFARPGTEIVSIVDRSIIRLVGDAPESDFDIVAPRSKVKVHCFATNKDVDGVIIRRSPSADPSTRTVHFEIDLADAKRELPVGTTGEVHIEVGEAVNATRIPMFAASVRGNKATIYVVESGNVARSHTYKTLGEDGGTLYLEPELAPGAHIVTDGRNTLNDGDHVEGKPDTMAASATPPPAQMTTPSGKDAVP